MKMTKKVTRPDGTTEEITGTPEEIAAYERALRGEKTEGPAKKQPVLKGKELEELRKELSRQLEQIQRSIDQKPSWFVPFWQWYVPIQVQPAAPLYPHYDIWCGGTVDGSGWLGDLTIDYRDGHQLLMTETGTSISLGGTAVQGADVVCG